MFNKINNQINDFARTIKEVKGCDEMLLYINSSFFAAIKMLMFASSTFSIYCRVLLFIVITFIGLFLFSMIGTIAISSTLLLGITCFLFIVFLLYITHYKNVLVLSIKNTKSRMEENKK